MGKIVQRIPIFARGSEEAMMKAINPGGRYENLDRIMWCYINDGERQGQLAFVTPPLVEGGDKIVEFMVGDNKKQIQVVDALPSPSEAETEVFYVLGTAVYLWTGEAYLPMLNVDDLENRVSALETQSATFAEQITAIQAGLEDYQTFKEATTVNINNLSNALSTAQSNISNLQTRMMDAEEHLVNLEPRMDAAESAIEALQTTTATNIEDITTNTAEITALDDRTSTNETDINVLQSSMSTAQSNITTLQNDTAANTAAIDDLTQDLASNYYTADDTDVIIMDAIQQATEMIIIDD